MRLVKIVAVLTLLAVTFAGGYVVRASRRAAPAAAAGPRVLYYVDAMNPAYKSDKPGTAPDGMALQPVYADEPTGASGTSGADGHAGHTDVTPAVPAGAI